MAKDKLNNLLSFDQYGELKQFKKSTKRTEIGGDVVNERKSGCSCSKPVMKPKKMAIKKSKHILEFSEYTNEGNFFQGVKNFVSGMSRNDAMKLIQSWKVENPRKYQKFWEQADEEMREKLIQFLMANPHALYFAYDDKKGQFVDTGIYTSRTGVGGTGYH